MEFLSRGMKRFLVVFHFRRRTFVRVETEALSSPRPKREEEEEEEASSSSFRPGNKRTDELKTKWQTLNGERQQLFHICTHIQGTNRLCIENAHTGTSSAVATRRNAQVGGRIVVLVVGEKRTKTGN